MDVKSGESEIEEVMDEGIGDGNGESGTRMRMRGWRRDKGSWFQRQHERCHLWSPLVKQPLSCGHLQSSVVFRHNLLWHPVNAAWIQHQLTRTRNWKYHISSNRSQWLLFVQLIWTPSLY